MSDVYIPGTCNLGKSEVKRRQFVALLGLALSIFSAVSLWNASLTTKATVVLPLFVFSVGYVQSRKKFCMAYGFAGSFNLGKLGELARVSDPADRAADRKMALRILLEAALLAVALTAAYLVVSSLL
ncbi:MAG: hypothetical protein ACO3CW_03475 [Candidatus Nanopelagicaceae bacterium]|jgi:hypothetical protein|nr:hypothetical protein [Actinomycetota bacterium]